MAELPDEIEVAQADVEALEKDAQELQRLHDERAGQLEELKASGSRDFARMAEIEGQRAALATMCADQDAAIGEARARLADLEDQARRSGLLAQIGRQAADIEAAQRERHALTLALRDALPGLLLPILNAVARWRVARQEWVDLAGELGTPVLASQIAVRGQAAEDQARALYAELEARGVNTEPLRWNPPGNPYPVAGALTLERVPFPPSTSPLGGELDWLIPELIAHAEAAQIRAAGVPSGHIGPRPGSAVVPPETLASTAYAPPVTAQRPRQSFTILSPEVKP